MMKILSYNIRGLGDHSKKLDLRQMIRFLCPAIICIQETLSSVAQAITYFLDICPAWHSTGVDAIGHSGGLLSMWDLWRVVFHAHNLFASISYCWVVSMVIYVIFIFLICMPHIKISLIFGTSHKTMTFRGL